MKITPPKGYTLLKKGTRIAKGDRYLDPISDKWEATACTGETFRSSMHHPHARKTSSALNKSSICHEQALTMLRRVGPIEKLPEAIAHRLAMLETMLQRRPTASEIALTITQCAGEKVITDNIHAGFGPMPIFDGGQS